MLGCGGRELESGRRPDPDPLRKPGAVLRNDNRRNDFDIPGAIAYLFGVALPHENLTHAIIGAAIQVHRVLGPGFLESIYSRALGLELQCRGIRHGRERPVSVVYGGVEVGTHVLDLLVEDTIVVELKAVKRLDDVHFAIARSYLRAAGLEHGLLINFAATTVEARRVVASAGPLPGRHGVAS